MIFLVVVPVWAGFANYLLPLMIGARDVAFPRLNAWSYWMYLFGGLALYASMFFSPPEAGWFSYVPLSLKQYSAHQRPGGVDLHGPPHRPELDHRRDQLHRHDPQHARARHGLGPHAAVRVDDPDLRVPDHRRADVARRDRDDAAAGPQLRHHVLRPGAGGSALLWQHLFWFFGHPEVYILVLPAFGVFSEILPVFARKPIFGYKAIAAATAGIAFLGMLVWAHHMFATPMSTVVLAFFMLSSFIIAVPTGVKIFNWIATLWRGTVEWTVPLLYCVGGIFTFTMGGITGIFLAVFPIDWQLTDTYFVVAHFHYTAFGASAFAMLAALYYWFPKITRPDAEREPRQARLRADVRRLPPDVPDPALRRPERHAAAHLRVLRPRLDGVQLHLHRRRVHDRAERGGHGDRHRLRAQAAAPRPGRTRGRPTRSSGSRPRRRRRTTST